VEHVLRAADHVVDCAEHVVLLPSRIMIHQLTT
jgi:hypothetical protein